MTRWHRTATDLSHALTRRSLLLLRPLPLSTQPRSHQSSIRRIRSSIDSLLHQKILDRRTAEKLDEDLHRANCILSDGDAATYLPGKTQGRFLKMFLGPIDVRATRKEIQFKEDYNSYKDRTALLFLLFPTTLLVLRSCLWNGCMPAFPVQLYQACLLFLYTGLAMRGNVLRVNGSDIRPWWIYHHLLSLC